MPVAYEIDVARHLVLISVTGTVAVAELLARQEELRIDPAFVPDFASLTVFHPSTPLVATGADIKQLAAMSSFGPSDLHFGLVRMLEVFAEERGVEVRVFRDRAAAFGWTCSFWKQQRDISGLSPPQQ